MDGRERAATDPPAPGPDRQARLLLAVAAAAVALAAADTYVVVLALTEMMAGVGVGIESLQRGTPIISGFLLGYVAVLPLIGRLSDLVDRRRILLWCLVVLVVGSAVTAVSVELPVMVGGRFLQGLGGGGLVPATLALVADLWPPGRRGLPLGIVGGVQELGAVLGPLLGALVLVVADWRAIFWLNVVLGTACLLGVWRLGPSRSTRRPRGPTVVRPTTALLALLAGVLTVLTLWAPETLTSSVALGGPFVPLAPDSGSRVLTPVGAAAAGAWVTLAVLTGRRWLPLLLRADLPGAALGATALGALVLTFSTADPGTEVLGRWGRWLLPVGGLAVVGLVLRQRTASAPLVPRGVVRRRVWPALMVSLLVGAAIVAVVVDVPLLSRLTQGTDETDAALVLVRFLLAVPVGAVLGGWLLRRLGPAVVAAPALALAAVSILAMARWERGSLEDVVATTLPLVGAGLGVGLAIAPVNDAALADARADGHGTVSSLVVVGRMVGMVLGLALLTSWGLRRFHLQVAAMTDPTDAEALLDAAVVQVQTVLTGAGLAAALAAVAALTLGLRPVGPADREGAAPRGPEARHTIGP